MVMIFNSEKAREQLRTMGEVITFRLKERKVVGFDWATDKRGGKKLFDVFVEEEGKDITPMDLEDYIEYSGFKSLEEWIGEITRLHKCSANAKGFLYRVATYPVSFREKERKDIQIRGERRIQATSPAVKPKETGGSNPPALLEERKKGNDTYKCTRM